MQNSNSDSVRGRPVPTQNSAQDQFESELSLNQNHSFSLSSLYTTEPDQTGHSESESRITLHASPCTNSLSGVTPNFYRARTRGTCRLSAREAACVLRRGATRRAIGSVHTRGSRSKQLHEQHVGVDVGLALERRRHAARRAAREDDKRAADSRTRDALPNNRPPHPRPALRQTPAVEDGRREEAQGEQQDGQRADDQVCKVRLKWCRRQG